MIHSRSTVLRGLLGLGLVCSFLAVAHAQPAERRYPLAERGALRLAVPQGWSEQVARRDALTPPTIGYGPEAGNQRAAGQLEANLSWWEYFTEVTLAKWLER